VLNGHTERSFNFGLLGPNGSWFPNQSFWALLCGVRKLPVPEPEKLSLEHRRIDFDDFYLENPDKQRNDPDAFSSREGGRKQLRNLFGGSAPRYTKTKTTYNPISDKVEEISPAQQHMLTFALDARFSNRWHPHG
jgi:hypothetical protein